MGWYNPMEFSTKQRVVPKSKGLVQPYGVFDKSKGLYQRVRGWYNPFSWLTHFLIELDVGRLVCQCVSYCYSDYQRGSEMAETAVGSRRLRSTDNSRGPRTERLAISLTPEDKAQLEECAWHAGITASLLVSMLARAYLTDRSILPLPEVQ